MNYLLEPLFYCFRGNEIEKKNKELDAPEICTNEYEVPMSTEYLAPWGG